MPLFEDAESFEHLAAYRESSVQWTDPDGVVTLRGATVSPTMFPLLRATPHLGRLFAEEEAREGADRVVLLSHRAWTNRFATDPDIVGTPLDLDGDTYTVVGVLAEGFYFPNPDGELWTPFVVPPFASPAAAEGGRPRVMVTIGFSVLGRLAPGVSPEQAATEARAILQRSPGPFVMRGPRGGRAPGDSPEIDARVAPLLEEMVGRYRPALLALSAATALVLLIACINVAGLLLARGVTRRRTLAVCAALGAGRGRLVRQLLTESVVLGVGGGALGLAAAALVLRVVPALVPGDVARLDEVGLDGVVAAFTLGLSVAAGLLFGAAPALQWSRLDLVRTLNEGSAQSMGGFRLLRSNRARAALAVGSGGPGPRAARGGGAAPAQLRTARQRRSRLRPGQRRHRPRREPRPRGSAGHHPRVDGRDPGGRPPLPGIAPGGDGAVGGSLRGRRDRVVVAPSPRAGRARPPPRSAWPALRLPPTRATSRGPCSTPSAPATST